MARRTPRPRPTLTHTLAPVLRCCPVCHQSMAADYLNHRTVSRLDGVWRLALRIHRCHNFDCPRFHRPYRPEAEPHFALPHHEFGLDVLALVGRLRHAEHRSVPEIHHALTARGVTVAERTVANLLERYDELRALATSDPGRLGPLLRDQGRVVLAIDGLQPDVGHEVLWVLRDCLSGEVLLARSLLSGTVADLSGLLAEVRDALPVPITGVVSDGQGPIRTAVAQTLPGVPHQLCQFHYLREAARPIYEADRHAKKELKKRVRGIRPIERAAEGQEDDEGEAVRGYCAAVRAALTDDGQPPLVASGLRLHERLEQIAASLDRVQTGAGALPKGLLRLRQLLRRGLEQTAALWPGVRQAYRWVRRVARLLENKGRASVRTLRRRLSRLLTRLRQETVGAADPAVAGQLRHFVKVTRSYRPGLFGCYAVADLPRTNNDLEQLFGSHRYHERRASGRKVASPGLVVSGAVRVLSGLATRLRPDEGLALSRGYVPQWQQLRTQLERRREARRRQRRFRHEPTTYLAKLEQLCLKQSLLS
jgi:hypothetical protein